MAKYNRPRFAVLGAGCGGQTFAGRIASLGYEVSLYNRTRSRLGQLPTDGYIRLEGAIEAEGTIVRATNNIGEAVQNSDVLLVATTALGHKDIARTATPYLKDGQVIVLNPSRTFGALEVANEIYSRRPELDVVICEANTLAYACRVLSPGHAKVHGVKSEVALAALRPEKTDYALELLTPVFPNMRKAENILETSLGNIGAIFHPTITLFNSSRINAGEQFEFYREGVDETVAEFMKAVDAERMAIASRLDTRIPTLEEWLSSRYSIEGDDLMHLLHNNPSYEGLFAPNTVIHRYLLEDVPTGLVPLSLVGKALDIETPNMDTLISRANEATGMDLAGRGRTLERLGLVGGNIQELLMDFIYRPEKVEASR
jgi:opine dehydrogenase